MSHLISVEIDSDVARKTLELLRMDECDNPNSEAWISALEEAFANDDAVENDE